MSKENSKSQINDIPPQEVPQEIELPNQQTPKQGTPNEKNFEPLNIQDEEKPLKEKKTEAVPEKTAPKPKEEIVYPEVSYFKVQYATAECSDYIFLFIGLIGSMGMGCSMPLFSLIFGNTINNFGPQNSMSDFVDRINSMVLKFVYCAIGMFVGSGLMVAFFTISGKRATAKLKAKYFETIMKQEQGYFDKANPFEYSTKVQSQTKVIETGVSI